ncbi:MAG: hypothetical protein ACD_7C00288G0005 [uncultured bacterium]|nr:MAG: hypothetical protein ACD_7C00288G0005 [uncultured bacterium]
MLYDTCYMTCGEMPERLNGTLSKSVVREIGPRVRIPPSPPLVRRSLDEGDF